MTASFSAAGTTSTAFEPHRQNVLAVVTDSAFDSVTLTFQAQASDGSWYEVKKPDGTAYGLTATASDLIYVDEVVARLLAAFHRVRLASSIAQGDATTVEIITR